MLGRASLRERLQQVDVRLRQFVRIVVRGHELQRRQHVERVFGLQQIRRVLQLVIHQHIDLEAKVAHATRRCTVRSIANTLAALTNLRASDGVAKVVVGDRSNRSLNIRNLPAISATDRIHKKKKKKMARASGATYAASSSSLTQPSSTCAYSTHTSSALRLRSLDCSSDQSSIETRRNDVVVFLP